MIVLQRTVRGILCDVFISKRTDFKLPYKPPFQSTFEFYFLAVSGMESRCHLLFLFCLFVLVPLVRPGLRLCFVLFLLVMSTILVLCMLIISHSSMIRWRNILMAHPLNVAVGIYHFLDNFVSWNNYSFYELSSLICQHVIVSGAQGIYVRS